MSKRKPKQLRLANLSHEFQMADIPAHVVIIATADKEIPQIVEEMMLVPMDKSMLLDFLIGYEPRGNGGKANRQLDENEQELYRLQQLLNSRYHGTRVDWLSQDDHIVQMFRNAIANETWKPKLRDPGLELPVINN